MGWVYYAYSNALMTNDAFAAALVLACIPTGIASAIGGVWLYRMIVASLLAH